MATPIETLEGTVFQSQSFRDIDRELRAQALMLEFPMLGVERDESEIDWNFAILCASALTSAKTERSQKAVLRIAIGCMRSVESNETQKAAAGALLERTGNRLTVQLAEKKNLIDVDAWRQLPPAFRLEVIKRKLELTLFLGNGANVSINEFQREVWETLAVNRWTSISAPTSAGKSWIIRNWFLESLRESEDYTGVYLVPTRALVVEVTESLRREVPSGAGVFLMPWDPTIDAHRRRIFVLTQERLHLLQCERPDIRIDEMFVDEAQNLGDPGRGVLLAQVIERAVRQNTNMRLTYASPLSSNPEELLRELPPGTQSSPLLSELATVNQNLIWVERFPGDRGRRLVRLIHNGEPLAPATLTLTKKVSKVDEGMAHIVRAMGGIDGGNVVYANSPARAENVAIELLELLPEKAELDDRVRHLQDLVRSTIHPKYSLIEALEKGVAFHYGNMPLTVRTEIEHLFADGLVDYLICTSTLLEGVNLPCRNIFIRNPRKGRDGLKTGEFWNLAGRAGRWGKEFQGNIICIDTDNEDAWDEVPLVRRRGKLTRAVRTGISSADDLLAFMRTDTDKVSSLRDAEGLFSYLCATAIEGGLDALSHVLDSASVTSDRLEIARSVGEAIVQEGVPGALVTKHAGISPNAMQRLADAFRTSDLPVESFSLADPRDRNARLSYYRAFSVLSTTATSIFDAYGWDPNRGGDDKRKHVLSSLIVNWMNGMPLRALVEQRVRQETDPKKVGAAIRDVLKDIEQIARYEAPKYLECYADLLDRWSVERTGKVIPNRPDLVKMLELGVSRPSQTALMSLGLSRTVVLALPDGSLDDSWDPPAALKWLRSVDITSLKMPELLVREVTELLGTYAQSELNGVSADG